MILSEQSASIVKFQIYTLPLNVISDRLIEYSQYNPLYDMFDDTWDVMWVDIKHQHYQYIKH
jgi:hypothetical protein